MTRAVLKSQKIKPEKGQRWIQDWDEYNEIYVQDVRTDGMLVLTTLNPKYCKAPSAFSWSETPESWNSRLQGRRLICLDQRS